MPKYRRMSEDDAEHAVQMANTVGFLTEADIWRWMLSLGEGFCAELEDKSLVGTLIVIPFGEKLAMIAMMIVHAQQQQRGIGQRLLELLLESRPLGTLALYATSVGEKLYRPFGFRDQGANLRLEGALEADDAPAEPALRRMTEADIARVIQLDAAAQGAPRGALVRSLHQRAAAAYVIDRGDTELHGFGFASHERGVLRVGPLVAAHDTDAVALTRALSRGAGKVRIDCEPDELALRSWAMSRGLEAGEQSPRLRRGPPLAGARHTIRALAGRAFG